MIDAHAHLWLKQDGQVDGLPVYHIGGGLAQFGAVQKQMMPAYMNDGVNSAERFLASMDFAQVAAAVITQEYIDGNQDAYLRDVRKRYPYRFRVCSLYEEKEPVYDELWMDGIKIPAFRLSDQDLTHHASAFEFASRTGRFISIDLADGDLQTGSLQEMIKQYPDVKVAIGHFGMSNKQGWQAQFRLARNPNVYVESGGITWLYNDEYYPYPSAVRAIRDAADICGMHKLMWGSDYPRTMTAITYRMSWDFVEKSTELTAEEKQMFLHENAKAFYGFDRLADMPYVHHMAE